MKDNSRQFFIILFVLALIVNLLGINVKFFTDDPGLYASIAKNLVYKKEFLQLFTYNQDWLDKPHFPFWMAFFSFKLFGISSWAYRLPALLFFMLGCVYTFLFARKYYGLETAAIAVLILMTAQNVFMGNTDVRAEPYLMGLIMGSIYHISRLDERFTLPDLLLAALLTACAVMTKGLFVLVAICGALIGQLILQKRFIKLFNFKWLLLIVLTVVFILPEIYAVYIQFDLHPEKTVFDTHHVSGIKWFLWDSQFGRFVNNGPITRKSGDVFFYIHTLLWAFAPWCLLFYFAIVKNIQAIFQKRKLPEYYSISGALLLFVLFSLSRFQLPFYTNAIFPLFAIITAPYCFAQLNYFGTQFRIIGQSIYTLLLPIAILAIHFFMQPGQWLLFSIDCIVFGLLALFICLKIQASPKKVFMLSCTAVLFANFYLNTVFYNELTGYKGQIKAADYINQPQFNSYHIYSVRAENNIFQFYCNRPVDLLPLEQFNNFRSADSSAFYVNQQSMNYLLQNHIAFRVIKAFQNYPQENISLNFINKTNRFKVLDHVYLIGK